MEPMIFRFNCPFCGAAPGAVSLTAYLDRWRQSPESDFDALLSSYHQILATVVHGNSRWLTKKFHGTAENVLKWFGEMPAQASPNTLVDEKVVSLADCPVCLSGKGHRPHDRYFTVWSNACRVQTANFLYEAGIIIFAVVRHLPKWAAPDEVGHISDLLVLNQRALGAVGLLECPFCGRRTTCLYGDGSAENPHLCRWCFDACGGMGTVLRLVINADFSVTMEMRGASLPQKVDGNIIPWNLKLRKRRARPAD